MGRLVVEVKISLVIDCEQQNKTPFFVGGDPSFRFASVNRHQPPAGREFTEAGVVLVAADSHKFLTRLPGSEVGRTVVEFAFQL